MTELMKEQFCHLGPIDWQDVPHEEPELVTFLKETFAAAEVLANSIPLPKAPDNEPPKTYELLAKSATDTAVVPYQTALDHKHEEAQKSWGKPIKLNAKDNPLHVCMYKTAGHDRRGAWFARRSIHAGIKFSSWKKAMRREFLTSLKVKKGPGSGAVRGLAGDKRLEKRKIENVGSLEAWLLSSAFPGPVSPRDFVTLLLTSDQALSEKSILDETKTKTPPEHFMVVSRPLTHAAAGERDGLVRGFYESIEMAREIPGTGGEGAPPLIEWIMITRSDPGGGIPKFMVERGTPGSVVADVPKWIEWAISKADELAQADDEADDCEVEQANAQLPDPAASEPDLHKHLKDSSLDRATLTRSHTEAETRHVDISTAHGNSSLLGNLTSAVGSTMAGYLPYFKPQTLEYNGETSTAPGSGSDDSSDESLSDDGTYASAAEVGETTPKGQQSPGSSIRSGETLDGKTQNLNHHEKELMKIQAKRQALDAKLEKARQEAVKRQEDASAKEATHAQRTAERAEKERHRQEEKWAKETRRLEQRRQKEEKKAEEAHAREEQKAESRRRKSQQKDALARVTEERDLCKAKLKTVEEERDMLTQQIEELQRENTMMVQMIGAGETGPEALEKVKNEVWVKKRGRQSSKPGHGRKSSVDKVSIDSSTPAQEHVE